MASQSVAFIAGIVFMLSLWQDNLYAVTDKKGCEVTKYETVVSCHNLSSHEIPTNLSAKTEDLTVLDSFLKKDSIKADSFKPYSNLKILEIRHIGVYIDTAMEFHMNAFSSLLNLNKLILGGIPFSSSANPDYRWPINLEILQLYGIKVKTLHNTKSLGSLTELRVEWSELHTFPELNVTAPLESIILEENPIQDIQASQIAPFCTLLNFQFSFKNTSSNIAHFLSTNKSCVCLRLQNWLRKRQITVTFSCAIYGNSEAGQKAGNLNCPNANSFNAEDALYDECIARQPGSSLWELLLYALFFAVLFPIGYLANETVNRFTTSSEGEHDSHPVGGVTRRLGRLCRNESSSLQFDEEECGEEIQPEDV